MFARLRYNPGFVVGLLLDIPIGIYTIVCLSAHGARPTDGARRLRRVRAAKAALMIYGVGILTPRLRTTAHTGHAQ